MKTALLVIGFLVSIVLSLFLGYRQGVSDGYEYTEKVNDIDHATGLMRTSYDSAFDGYSCYLKLSKAEETGDIIRSREEEREWVLYSIDGFREQAERIRSANINYPLLEIYEPQINKIEMELLQ